MPNQKMKSSSNKFGHSMGTAISKLVPGQFGKATFDGIYYSRVLLIHSQLPAPKGASLRFLRIEDSTTALVEPVTNVQAELYANAA